MRKTCPAACARSSIGNTQLFSQYDSDTFSFVRFKLVCVGFCHFMAPGAVALWPLILVSRTL